MLRAFSTSGICIEGNVSWVIPSISISLFTSQPVRIHLLTVGKISSRLSNRKNLSFSYILPRKAMILNTFSYSRIRNGFSLHYVYHYGSIWKENIFHIQRAMRRTYSLVVGFGADKRRRHDIWHIFCLCLPTLNMLTISKYCPSTGMML
jgi:hypothetical protein